MFKPVLYGITNPGCTLRGLQIRADGEQVIRLPPFGRVGIGLFLIKNEKLKKWIIMITFEAAY